MGKGPLEVDHPTVAEQLPIKNPKTGWPTGFSVFARPVIDHGGQDHFPRAGFYLSWRMDMDQMQKQALQVTKEIMVKFIETNRVSPTNFSEMFRDIYRSVLTTIRFEDGLDIPDGDEDPEIPL